MAQIILLFLIFLRFLSDFHYLISANKQKWKNIFKNSSTAQRWEEVEGGEREGGREMEK